jgi:hypothetical protein
MWVISMPHRFHDRKGWTARAVLKNKYTGCMLVILDDVVLDSYVLADSLQHPAPNHL